VGALARQPPRESSALTDTLRRTEGGVFDRLQEGAPGELEPLVFYCGSNPPDLDVTGAVTGGAPVAGKSRENAVPLHFCPKDADSGRCAIDGTPGREGDYLDM
jgi:hypothetical protein